MEINPQEGHPSLNMKVFPTFLKVTEHNSQKWKSWGPKNKDFSLKLSSKLSSKRLVQSQAGQLWLPPLGIPLCVGEWVGAEARGLAHLVLKLNK